MIDMIDLVDTVQAYLDAFNIGAHVSLGWAEQGKQTNQGTGGANRVIFVPADGEFEGTQYPGGNPRALFDDLAKFEVRVWAVDRSSPAIRESHAHQANATKALFAWVVRAISGFNRPSVGAPAAIVPTYAGAEEWGPYKWTPDPSENAFGRELRVPLTLRSPLADVDFATFSAVPALTKNVLSQEP